MITDTSIAATLLWPELAALATIYGPTRRQPRIIGKWTLTPDYHARSVSIAYDGLHIGTIGPGETTNLSLDLARHLRRDLHEHVYQHNRNRGNRL